MIRSLGRPKSRFAALVISRVALVSATGSVRMGREVGPVVAERFGRHHGDGRSSGGRNCMCDIIEVTVDTDRLTVDGQF